MLERKTEKYVSSFLKENFKSKTMVKCKTANYTSNNFDGLHKSKASSLH